MDAFGEKILGTANFSSPGQKRQHRTGIGAQRHRDGIGHLPFQRRIGLSAEIARLDRKRAALAGDHRRIAQQRGDPRPVERRRHHQDAQILAQSDLRIARQRQAEIRIERALVKFVEQHGCDPGQFGIIENLPRENALGDNLDPGRARYLRAEPDTVAHGLADTLADRLRHPFGTGAGRDPPRLQHDDFLGSDPWCIQQRQRHPRGLARPRRRYQYGSSMARECAGEFVQHRVDWKRGVEAAGQYLYSVITREGG